MTCKAFNGRVVAEWLLDCAIHADDKRLPGGNRKFGQWLQQEILAGSRTWPDDERLLPQRLCMKLGICHVSLRSYSPI